MSIICRPSNPWYSELVMAEVYTQPPVPEGNPFKDKEKQSVIESFREKRLDELEELKKVTKSP